MVIGARDKRRFLRSPGALTWRGGQFARSTRRRRTRRAHLDLQACLSPRSWLLMWWWPMAHRLELCAAMYLTTH